MEKHEHAASTHRGHAGHGAQAHGGHEGMAMHHYRSLLLMALLSFVAMYILMYAMVNAFDNVFASFNQFYMAGLMSAPMVLIELLLMRSMYKNARLNAVFAASAIVLGLAFWFAIRSQAAIHDEQFLKSMIPHHAGAILMCEKAQLSDADNRRLCQEIIRGQQAEIDQMKAKLREIGG